MKIAFMLIVFAVIIVNGFTDAPNAVASCISSRAMKQGRAILLAGAFNFLGAVAASIYFSGVTESVFLMVDFGEDTRLALSSLFAGMCAVVIWALIAFCFGIPTSESHALISGIVGAALGGRMSADAVRFSYLLLVFIGLFVSTVPAYCFAKYIYLFFVRAFKRSEKLEGRYFFLAQRIGVALSGFLHGAQDSQKFVAVIMLGMSLYNGGGDGEFKVPVYLSLACAVLMTLGTLIGGKRIIKKVGEDMVRLDAPSGAAADLASAVVLIFCTFFGIPVSTTHSKTCAMMGAGELTKGGLDKKVAQQMIWAWILTFPCCAVLGFILGWLMNFKF